MKGLRLTTALEYRNGSDADRWASLEDINVSPFGPRHWVPGEVHPQSRAYKRPTACGIRDGTMAFTTGTNGLSDVDCPACKSKLDDWLAKYAATRLQIIDRQGDET